MSPKKLYELLQEIKAEINEINAAWVVVDDSQLGNTLERRTIDDNAYLVGVLPSYGTAEYSGSTRETTSTMLMLVEKTDYSELTEDEFIAVFERTYQLANKVKEILIDKVEQGCYPEFYHLDIEGLKMSPIWKKSQCNGWYIDLEF